MPRGHDTPRLGLAQRIQKAGQSHLILGRGNVVSGITRLILSLTPSRCALRASLRLSEFVPDEFVEPVGSHPRRHHQKSKTPHLGAFCFSGGESGIRTHGRLTPTAVFKTAALNHSAISPELVVCCKARVARHYGSFISGILPSPLRGHRLRRCSLRLPAFASRLLP
jgi:hypothetical protein